MARRAEVAAADIGGTHARFAIAEIRDGRGADPRGELVLKTADYPGLPVAWQVFVGGLGRATPRDIAIALACPVSGGELRLTNSTWVIRPAELAAGLDVDRYLLVNDFGAVAHAVAQL